MNWKYKQDKPLKLISKGGGGTAALDLPLTYMYYVHAIILTSKCLPKITRIIYLQSFIHDKTVFEFQIVVNKYLDIIHHTGTKY